jgi:hypothetical protein
MKVRVQVIIESDSGEQACIEEVASLRREALQPEDLGLTLAGSQGDVGRRAADDDHGAGLRLC